MIYYTCSDDFEITHETDSGEAIYQELEDHEEMPETIALFCWRATDAEIDEGVYELELVRQEVIDVERWSEENDYDWTSR